MIPTIERQPQAVTAVLVAAVRQRQPVLPARLVQERLDRVAMEEPEVVPATHLVAAAVVHLLRVPLGRLLLVAQAGLEQRVLFRAHL